MSRRKVFLKRKKYGGTPAHQRRAAETSQRRQLQNAAIKYRSTVDEFQNCKVHLPCLLLPKNRVFQELVVEGQSLAIMKPKVLSLFDGISSGLVALKQLGIIPEKYFASEIDPHCLKLQRFNFGHSIEQLGSVCDLNYEKLKALGRIDILFGGAPCNDLSSANPRKKGLDAGTGVLFYEFVRILLYHKIKAYFEGKTDEFFWFFENTSSMLKETKEKISRYLGCKPLTICASKFVPMRRKRYFWTNILTMEEHLCELELNVEPVGELQNYLCGTGRRALVREIPTFTSSLSNMCKGGQLFVVDDQTGEGHLHYTELEKLFGFPENFTAGPNTPLHARRKVLSKSWDVHTIVFLLKPLINKFRVENRH